jgi:hypothetical protein
MRVIAQTLLWLRAEERYVEAGEAFDYPAGPDLDRLLAGGLVAPAEESPRRHPPSVARATSHEESYHAADHRCH